MITVLAYYERISLFHTMEPFFLPQFRRLFCFTQSPEFCLQKDRNRILFMERWFKTDLPPDLELMQRLREHYDTIYFFDGYAAAGTHLIELLPYVDRLYHKALCTDPENYRRPLYNKRLFADYYAQKYSLQDSQPEYRQQFVPSRQQLQKLQLSWNIGLGEYPRRHLPQRIGTALARYLSPRVGRLLRSRNEHRPADFAGETRSLPVHARFGLVSSATVAKQRTLILDKIEGRKEFLTGFVPQSHYYRELADAKITLSPFGWGEVCFRDFEAVVMGSMLLKPDMSHLQTWPDIYVPYETYVPVGWDAEDLIEKSEYYLSHPAERKRIAENAYQSYREQLARLPQRFEELLTELHILHRVR